MGSEHTIENTDVILQSCIPVIYIMLLTDVTLIHLIKNILLSVKSCRLRDRFIVKLMKLKFQNSSLTLTSSETLEGVLAMCSHGYVFLQK